MSDLDDGKSAPTRHRLPIYAPSSTDTQIVVRPNEPGDRRNQHYFQHVLWMGNAESRDEALVLWGEG